MKLLSLSLENFGSFVSASLSLDERGLVLVQGDNALSTSADSNGSGKSTVLEAIVYGLYGKTVRYELKGKKPTGDLMVNSRFGSAPGKNSVVQQTWDMDGRSVTISRYRKHKTGKNGVTVSIDGTDYTRGTSSETDRFIVELVGLDFPSFVRSVYFDGKSIVPFPTLPDSEIKAVFERVLGLDDLAKVAAVVKEKIKVVSSGLDAASNAMRLEAAQESTAEVERLTAISRAGSFKADQERAISEFEAEIARVLAEPVRSSDDIDDEESRLDVGEALLQKNLSDLEPLDDLIQKWAADKASVDRERALGRAKINELRSRQIYAPPEAMQAAQRLQTEIARLQAQRAAVAPPTSLVQKVSAVQTQMRFFEAAMKDASSVGENASSKIGQPCGECGKLYTQDDLGHIVDHQAKRFASAKTSYDILAAELAAVETKVAQAVLDISGQIDADISALAGRLSAALDEIGRAVDAGKALIAAEIAAVEAGLASLEKTLAQLEGKSPQFDKLKETRESMRRKLSELPGMRAALQAQRYARTKIDASVSALRTRINEERAKPNPYSADIQRWASKLETHREAKADLTSRMERAGREMATLKALDEAYGRTGLKAHIIEVVTPILNARANEYATRLVDGSVRIEFSTLTKLRDGTYAERFAVTVQNDQGADGYLGCSSGEQRKVDLAIALAMSDLVAARSNKAIDLWVADEIAESLDPTAVDRVVDVLKDKAAERGTLLVISHADMRDLIPNVITVRKTAAGSELV